MKRLEDQPNHTMPHRGSLVTWLSFLPAMIYWILEIYTNLVWALIGGISLSIIEITLEKIFLKKVHQLTIVNTVLIISLGSISLMAQDGFWFKMQPVLTGLGMSGFLHFYHVRKRYLMLETLLEMQPQNKTPSEFIMQIETSMKYFLILYSIFMLPVALYLSTSQWLFWKTGGFYISMLVLFISQMWWYYHKIKKRGST